MSDWKKYFWRNTASNYIRTVTRLALGLVLFRLLFSGLSPEEFGFWSLLWSLFGYGILLDFGFGFTAQKAVAEKTAQEDWIELSRLLSTIFWTFMTLAVVLCVFFFAIKNPFLSSIQIKDTQSETFTYSYLFFFAGMSLIFPLGLFTEMLRGLQRLDIANWLNTASVVLNFIGILAALHLTLPFHIIVLISSVTVILPNLAAAFVVMRKLPMISLHPRHFQVSTVKSQLGFSFSAYAITFSNLIMAKSDQMVVGLMLGVGAIAVYQAGYKIAEMLNLFTIQLQDALSPAAASLNASKDEDGLRDLLLKTSRLTFLVTTPLYALSAAYLEPLIRLLTGLEEVGAETYWVGQILLLAIYFSQLTNSCTKRILMMCGYEKKLLWISVIDAGANLSLSLILASQIGLIGVALGTLIPTSIIGVTMTLPMALKYLSIRPIDFLKEHFKGTWKPLAVFASALAAILTLAPISGASGIVDLIWRGSLAGGPAAFMSLNVLRSMKQ